MKCFIIAAAFAALVATSSAQSQEEKAQMLQNCLTEMSKCQAHQGQPPQQGQAPDMAKHCASMKKMIECTTDVFEGACKAITAMLPPQAKAGMDQTKTQYGQMCGTYDQQMGNQNKEAAPATQAPTTAAAGDGSNAASGLRFSLAAFIAVVVALVF